MSFDEQLMKTIRDEPFQAMFEQYCARRSIDPSTVHFLLNGRKLDLGTTPADEDLATFTHNLLVTSQMHKLIN